jgi:pimeloyl-ACP methyl ester carboxylesterase
MADRWLVFGGWAVDPRILEPLFGDSSIYVDVNALMPLFLVDGTLNASWLDVVEQQVRVHASGGVVQLAGWSTGAIIACALAARVAVKRLVLLSATPSFCRRKAFGFGWRPGVLRNMREQLYGTGNAVVTDFLDSAGVPETFRQPARLDERVLAAGLSFLEQVNLVRAFSKPACRATVLHGREDFIVPSKAGEVIAEMLGTKCQVLEGGHAFFVEQREAVRELIRR